MAEKEHDTYIGEKIAEPVTRRQLLSTVPGVAAIGAAVAAAAVGTVALSGCSSSDDDDTPDVLTVSNDAVTTLDAYKEIEKPEKFYQVYTITDLDRESTFYSSDGKTAAVLAAGDTASPLNILQLMNLETGEIADVLDQPVGFDDGFEIYEVRCSSEIIIWVESNYLTDDWKVYCASINPVLLTMGTPTLLDEGGVNYDAPAVAAAGGSVYWIVQPSEDGEKTTDNSYLKSTAGNIITSQGRFNGGLETNGETITCMPRANTSSGVYYVLTAVSNGSVIATETLPQSYKPNTAIYMRDRFCFGISGSYDYGDGIANMGTYYPTGDGEYLRLIREPITSPGWCSGWLFCKSGSRTVFVDVEKQRYFVVNEPSNSEDYGDYSVQLGEVSEVINYATIVKSGKKKASKTVELRRILLTDISSS